ncbi:MAG: hypothetical protein NZ556_02845 [Fimbriimonadales bacterium]|nr:hypothetical protein [Fimbriimonadales bacterium]
MAWTALSKHRHGQDCPCYLHGLEARATQGRRRDADAMKARSHS